MERDEFELLTTPKDGGVEQGGERACLQVGRKSGL